ncbi:hypothetical protein HanXRQr2_Chr09g0416431 [Helianthus annuus]|uniref:Transmembrane protein n=1 Tax=Helianthus annuus TaxID=4232 RepID=A0A251U1Z8_HELAN|nr:hypothetical protein HanXRQr2_Chr09g0416431 [Helianthus annuus]KAJ0537068.1 hypothetical protein HanIR_Chr09g0448671 [Helianthus annuus]
MANKSLSSVTMIFIFIIVLSHPMHPQSDAVGLTSRQLFQNHRYPPCLCCQTDAPPPPHCYCACFVTDSRNKSP